MKNDKDDLPSLKELEKSIKDAKRQLENKTDKKNGAGAMGVSIDLLSGVAVGSIAGYYIDKFAGTTPIFFILCFFLGVAGSFLNIYRNANKDNKEE